MELSLPSSAVSQCFSLVSLCFCISDPNWIEVYNASDSQDVHIYGVVYTWTLAHNITDQDSLRTLQKTGLILLFLLASSCYIGVLTSSGVFLLDLLGGKKACPGLSRSLHILMVLLCLCVVSVGGACFYVITYNIRKTDLSTKGFIVIFGESYYISLFALAFSCLAMGFSLRHEDTQQAQLEGYQVIEESEAQCSSTSLQRTGSEVAYTNS
ncbi:transmembrane protein 127 [Polypterus senegalus]|uniref:transmembrane protein 127 n=1 Tax=Polypterus senegalus TaxID=55291 RepID=UPI001966226D|nr:transmembrane protein 127 [Polypterus senegalus]XP_039614996.1 transmembrane protein 127 [Polypterus senegalus]XP_039614997.1 transmembrane protein 127 [Polypterus senegalus]XP_039614998.1 transmembrane protein 127 [Polypterus senegalus]